MKKGIFQYIDGKKDELLQLASKYGIYEDLAGVKYIDGDYDRLIDELIKKLDSFSDNLEEQLPGAFMDLFTRMTTIRSQTIQCAGDALNSLREEFADICDELLDKALSQMDNYRSNVGAWANERKENLTQVKNEKHNKENLQKEFYAKAEQLEKTGQYLTEKIEVFKKAEAEAARF